MPYANTFKPMGFNPLFPVGRLHSNTVVRPVPSARTASAGGNASTDLAIGDAYALDVNGNAYRAGPNDVVKGIVIGFQLRATPAVMNTNGPVSIDYVTGAGTFPQLIGVEDAGAEFEVQCDTLSQANASGGKFNLLDAAPDPTYRQSRQSLNIGGGAGTQFAVVGLVNRPTDNVFGAFAKAAVRILTTIEG